MGMSYRIRKLRRMLRDVVEDKDIELEDSVNYPVIVCDYCGRVIVDGEKGISNSYIEVNGKYYHVECWEVVNYKRKLREVEK